MFISTNMSLSDKKKTQFNSEEDLKNHFQSIHDYIRNKFGFFGKTALQFFNFLFVLKLIEPEIKKGHFKSINKCLYSKLKDAETGALRNELLSDYRKNIYQNDDGKQLKDTIFMVNSFSDFNDKNDYLKGLLEKIDLLTPEVLDKFHVHGRIYEYFLGFITQKNKGKKSGSQIDDLGQYFTSRKIVRYCMRKVDPIMIGDKNVNSMGDFFCGSGGFITEYIRYLEHKYFDKISWENQTNKIFGADTDRDIIKSARVDIMLLTKTFGKSKNTIISNIKRLDSTFDDDFFDSDDNGKEVETKVFYNFTNPPYGGDKGKDVDDKVQLKNANKQIKHVASTGSINLKNPPKSWKPTKSKSYLINGDNKETLALLHGMGVLEKDGIYCGVLKEGVFFDGKFTDLRTQLIENYSVQWVISVPQSDFWNTSTKTSILIFKNTGTKTNEIKFCELKEIKNSSKFNEINPQTGKIIGEFDPENYKLDVKSVSDYLTIKYDELKEKGYSLNFKDYIKQDIKVNEGFKIVKLGDICEMKSGFAFKSEEFIEKGIRLVQVNNIKDNYITKKEEDKFIEENINYNKYIINKGDIVIAITGSYGDKIAIYNSNEKAYLNQNMCILHGFENNDISTYVYLYWIHSGLIDKIKFSANGSTLKFISKEFIKNLEIPIPEDTNTIKLYLDYLNPANETLQTLQTLQTQKEKAICGMIKMMTSFGKKGVEWDEYRLGDVINSKSGKHDKKVLDEKGKYPYYNASINNPYGKTNEYCFEGEEYLIFVNGGGNVNNKISDSHGLGMNFLVKGKSSANVKLRQLTLKKNIMTYVYLHYYLKVLKPIIQEDSHYTTGLGNIDVPKFNDLKIRVLKPHIMTKYKLQEEFDFMDKLKSDIANTLKNQEDITKQMMKLVLGGSDDKKTNNYDLNEINTIVDKQTDLESEKSFKSSKSSKLSKSTKIIQSESEFESESNSDLDDDSKTSKTSKTKSVKSSKIVNDEPKEKKNKSRKLTKLEK